MKYFNLTKLNMKHFNRIKAFIFPPLQLPLLNNKKIKKMTKWKPEDNLNDIVNLFFQNEK